MGVVEGSIGIQTSDLDNLEVVVGGALGGGRISVLEEVGCVVGSCLRLVVGVLGMGDAPVGHVTKCRWHFHGAEFRHLVFRLFSRSGGGIAGLGFGGGGGLVHNAHPF